MTILTALGIASMAFTAWFTWRQYGTSGSAREALVAAWVNILIGFSMNFCANLLLLPMMTSGGQLSAGNNFMGGWVFTALSLVRQYYIHLHAGAIHKLASRLARALWR